MSMKKVKFDIGLTKDNKKFKIKDLSTGQALMLQIAFKLALLLNKGEEGLVLADEGMSALDGDNLLHVINMFSEMPFQLVFVLHNVNDLPAFVNVIDLDQGE